MMLAVLAGFGLGGIGASLLHAQTKPPAYYVADFELTDAEGIKPYSAAVASTFAPFGGRFLVRGGTAKRLEGELPKGRLVMIAFDNIERAQAWYDSPAYTALRPHRQRSGRTQTFIVEGVAN